MILSTPITQNDHYRGRLNAPVNLVEYGDFQCPYCARAFPLLERVFEKNKNEMCFVYRQFPLTHLHPLAALASVASEAAGLQQNFWQMHELLFLNYERVSEDTVMEMAEELGLDLNEFFKDLSNPDLINRIQRDLESGIQSGVAGTPTLYLNGRRFEQPRTYESLNSAIAELAGEINRQAVF